ncbi:hypothetical protein BT69DRAFT_1318837 [Atractiella rhizophila]|nr:hypothetical protein BT69DRAFT_1318837 [Atractiella rhizophila]
MSPLSLCLNVMRCLELALLMRAKGLSRLVAEAVLGDWQTKLGHFMPSVATGLCVQKFHKRQHGYICSAFNTACSLTKTQRIRVGSVNSTALRESANVLANSMGYFSNFHCAPIVIERTRTRFPLLLAVTPRFVVESGFKAIRVYYHESSIKSSRVPTNELDEQVVMLPLCETDELTIYVDELLPQKCQISFTSEKLPDYWKELSIQISLDRVIYPIAFEARQSSDIVWGPFPFRTRQYYARSIIFQLSHVPAAGAIHRLPDEILHQIMTEFRRSQGWSPTIRQVCRKLNEVASYYLAEPNNNGEKLRLLHSQPSSSSLWRTFRYTAEDVKRDLDLLPVLLSSRHITSVSLEAGPVDSVERKKLLDQLVRHSVIESIAFAPPWTTKDIFTFIEHSHSSLRSLQVHDPVLVPEALDEGFTRSPGTYNRLSFFHVPFSKCRVFGSILAKISAMSSQLTENQLQMLEIVRSFPLPDGLEEELFSRGFPSLANLRHLRLDCLPYQLSNNEHLLTLSAPLPILQFRELTHLILEGYDESSLLVPYDFFAHMLQGYSEKLQYLSLKYCSIGFSHFREFCALFFRTARFTEWDSRMVLVLFFDEWEEGEVINTWGGFPVLMDRLTIYEGGEDPEMDFS